MFSFFRRFLGSKVGAFIALSFLAIIAVAFAASDITGSGGGIGSFLGGGGKVADVGGSSVSAPELQSRAQRIFEQQRRANPGLKMETFVAQGGVDQIFDQIVAGQAVMEYGDDQGMTVTKRMVDGRIAAIPAFQDASGAFSPDLFRQLLAREGVSEKSIRDEIASELMGRQLVGPASLGVRLPDSLTLPYASLLLEARKGRIAVIPASAFLAPGDPSDAELQRYYADNAGRFTVPEQRRLRYAIVDADRFASAAQPTDAEIAAYYNQNKTAYAARENRSVEQLILPTQAAATSIAGEIRGGKSMAAAAQTAGLAVSTLASQSRDDLARASSDAAAKDVFAATEGSLVGPVRLPLGWALLRVGKIQHTPAQPLAQVRQQIITTLTGQKQQKLLADFTGKVEDQVAEGGTFDEVVKDNGLSIETTPYMLSTGQSVQEAGYQPSADIQQLLRPGFEMEADDDAQLVPIAADKRYALLDVGETIAAAPPPLAKVRDVIIAQYKLAQGAIKAKLVAEQIRASVAKGSSLADAVAKLGIPMPPVQDAGGRRADVMRSDRRPPPPIALLFSMAPRSVKVLAMDDGQGAFVIQLNEIIRGDAGKQPQLVNRVRVDLSRVVGGEYTDQFERAIEKQLGVSRNAQALATVKQELRRVNGVAQ